MRGAAPVLALALAACTAAPRGAPPHPYPTLVSINPCTDAILAEVADPAQLLAISHYSHDPASSSMDPATARRFASTGGSVEEVLALRPDRVVSGTYTPPATVNALAGLGLPLEQVSIASTVAESEAQIRRLAGLAGHPERGEALVARIEAALANAGPPPGHRAISAVVWEEGGIVPGDHTLIAELLRRTGFANFSAAKGLGQADVLGLEAMVADPPALILATGSGRSGEDRLLAHPVLRELRGTRREALDPSLLYCAGPTIIRAAARLGAVRRLMGAASAGAFASSARAVLGVSEYSKDFVQPELVKDPPRHLSNSRPPRDLAT